MTTLKTQKIQGLIFLAALLGFSSVYADGLAEARITANQPIVINLPGTDKETGASLNFSSLIFTLNPKNGTVQEGRSGELAYIPNTRGEVGDRFSYLVLDNYGQPVYYTVFVNNENQVDIEQEGRVGASF